MEILSTDETPKLVTNLEVMQLLSSQTSPTTKRKHNKMRHCDWIQENVYAYLKNTPCANVQTENMSTLVKELKEKFELTQAESLQILNFMPRESVEIHLIIENLPSRLTEDRQDELLSLIGSYIKTDGDNVKVNGDNDEEIVGDIMDDLPNENILENGYDVSLLDDIPAVAMKDEPP
jgi:DNA-directed RNA polymerase subunit F